MNWKYILNTKFIYILDFYSYAETSRHEGQPTRFLNFLLSLTKEDYALVPKSMEKDIKELLLFNKNINATLIYISNTTKDHFYDNVSKAISSFNKNLLDYEIITYCYSSRIESILQSLGQPHFIDSDILKNLFVKSNPILNSTTLPTLPKTRVNSIETISSFFKKYKENNYLGIVLKKEIDEIGNGNIFLKKINNIGKVLSYFDINLPSYDTCQFPVEDSLIIEPWLGEDYRHLNFQFLINRNNDDIVFIGESEQFFEKYETNDFERIFFKGNTDITDDTEAQEKLARKLALKISKTGYCGIIGVDLYFNSTDLGIMEFNARFNSATALYLYIKKGHKSLKNRYWMMTDFIVGKENFDLLEIYFKENNLFYNSNLNVGVIIFSIGTDSLQLAIIGESEEYVANIYQTLYKLEKKYCS